MLGSHQSLFYSSGAIHCTAFDKHSLLILFLLFYFQQNGHSETKEAVTDTKKTNGHEKDEAYHSDSNGTSEPAPNAAEADIKGKQKIKDKKIVRLYILRRLLKSDKMTSKLHCKIVSKKIWRFRHIFMAFSEYLYI